jgi:hypothetical protein
MRKRFQVYALKYNDRKLDEREIIVNKNKSSEVLLFNRQ